MILQKFANVILNLKKHEIGGEHKKNSLIVKQN